MKKEISPGVAAAVVVVILAVVAGLWMYRNNDSNLTPEMQQTMKSAIEMKQKEAAERGTQGR